MDDEDMTEKDKPYEIVEVPAVGMRIVAATGGPLSEADQQKTREIARKILDDMKADRDDKT